MSISNVRLALSIAACNRYIISSLSDASPTFAGVSDYIFTFVFSGQVFGARVSC